MENVAREMLNVTLNQKRRTKQINISRIWKLGERIDRYINIGSHMLTDVFHNVKVWTELIHLEDTFPLR